MRQPIVWLVALVWMVLTGPAAGDHKVDEPEAGQHETEEFLPRPLIPDFQSPIASFKPFVDADTPDWKGVNDRVGEIGGWRVYAREPFEEPEPDTDVEGAGSEMDAQKP